jgi:exopolysaccharide production protein ExoQ
VLQIAFFVKYPVEKKDMPAELDNLNAQRHNKILPFALGFYFAFRVITVLVSTRTFGSDPRTGPEINVALDFLLLIATAFCYIGQARYPFWTMAKLPGIRWALLFLGFSFLSLSWSSTVSLLDSVVYWCGLAADFTIVALLLRGEQLTEASESLMRGFVWGALAMATIAWIMPAQSDLRLGDDELLGPNNIGYACALAFFFAQYLMREKGAKLGIPAFGLAVTLLRTLSKTTIVAFCVGQGFLMFRDKSINRRSKIVIVLAVVAMLWLFWGLLTSYYAIYTNAGTQSETLSGRFGIWAYFLLEAVQQPWIGHGFDSAWKVIPPFGPDQFEAAHAQNELLQQFYTYGAVGLCMFIGIYGGIYRHIRMLVKGPEKTFFFSFLLFIVVRGTADSDRFDLSLPLWAILMISILIDHARHQEQPSILEVKPALKMPIEQLSTMRSGI